MTEDHTKTLSVQALVLSKQIHFIASQCAVESLETISQIDEANMLIATKLKITTKYLAEMINDESALLTRLNT